MTPAKDPAVSDTPDKPAPAGVPPPSAADLRLDLASDYWSIEQGLQAWYPALPYIRLAAHYKAELAKDSWTVEMQAALDFIPREFVGNDAWQNGVGRLANALAAERDRATDAEAERDGLQSAKRDIEKLCDERLEFMKQRDAALAENARLTNENTGLHKANELFRKGMESQCELMDGLKQESRTLTAENAALRADLDAAFARIAALETALEYLLDAMPAFEADARRHALELLRQRAVKGTAHEDR